MMSELTVIEAILLGLVQGLGEFLPISSSGHLALLQHFFGIEGDSVLLFAVLLHLGTLISVFIIYWKDIGRMIIEFVLTIKDIFSGKGINMYRSLDRVLMILVIIGTIPTAIIGIVFKDTFESLYLSLFAIGIGLIFTGTILFVADIFAGRIVDKLNSSTKKNGLTRSRNSINESSIDFDNASFGRPYNNIKWWYAIIVGIMQGIAIAPGVSRSGSTLFGALITGIDRKMAVKFAFLLSIPAILGSVILEGKDAISAGV
ncbi:MAG: undecaprenyl-diphosphate phosphatase, partial [Anaerovoracaceae bacterium]